MDKVATKRTVAEAGVPTPRHEVVTLESLEGLPSRTDLPVVVKPVASGSSVDTTIESSADGLMRAVTQVVGKYGAALVEQFIDGPELTVGILDGGALPVCEIRTKRGFYDYQAKYVDDDTAYVFDLDMPPELLAHVQGLSVTAFGEVGCQHFGRVDWMVDRETGRPWMLEINTIPGFTSHSLLPKAAERVGIGFDELCARIVSLGLIAG